MTFSLWEIDCESVRSQMIAEEVEVGVAVWAMVPENYCFVLVMMKVDQRQYGLIRDQYSFHEADWVGLDLDLLLLRAVILTIIIFVVVLMKQIARSFELDFCSMYCSF